MLLAGTLLVSGCYRNPYFKKGDKYEKIETRYPNGKIKERYYLIKDKEGKTVEHWKHIRRYENGQLESECTYVYGVKTGRETFWRDTGRVQREVLYKNGKVVVDINF